MRDGVIVGVDAGGSQISAVAIDGAHSEVSAGHPAAHPSYAGVAAAAAALARAVEAATGGRAPSAIAAGVAGAGRAGVRETLEERLTQRFPSARVRVVDDAEIALRAGVPEGDGAVLVAGTGSIALACVGERRCRVGGYGYAIGDEGSGYALGAGALRLLVRAYEGRVRRDAMLDAIAERLRAESAADVMEAIYAAPSAIAAAAAVAPIVVEYAGRGERSANKLVQTAAIDLFDLVRALWPLAGLEPTCEMPLVFAGGLLAVNSVLTYLLEVRIGNELPGARIVKGIVPTEGALAIARTLLL